MLVISWFVHFGIILFSWIPKPGLQNKLRQWKRPESESWLEEAALISNSLQVADSQSAIGLECSHVDMIQLTMDQGILTHTNHYLKPHQGVKDLMALKDSPTRFKRFDKLLDERTKKSLGTGVPGLEDVRSLFKDEDNFPTSICRSPTQDSSIATLFNIVMDLKMLKAEVVVGKPSSATEVLFLIPGE